jgi:hypothetical protein
MASATSNLIPYPSDYKPIVAFDTSVHNRLMTDAAEEPTLTQIRSKRYVRVAGMSVEELAATPDAAKRESLFTYAELVTQDDESDCLMPHNVLIEALILDHYNNPWNFDWRNVDVRSWEYHDELRKREIVLDNDLASEQRQQQKELQSQFRQMFTSLRPALDEVFARHGTPRPLTFREALKGDESSNKRLVVTIGKRLYDRVTGDNISRVTVREFIAACPPFRAIIFGHMMAWYDLAVRDEHRGERFQCGRNDLFMAAYLPYCDEFITDEKHGEQERCLREIAEVANIPTEVLSFDKFLERLVPCTEQPQ